MSPKSPPTIHDELTHDHELACGSGIYGADRLTAKLEIAEAVLVLPNGWSVSGALLNPIKDYELAPVLSELVVLKNKERWPHDTYCERVATLTLWIAATPSWPWAVRCGAAWSTMVLGMMHHDFKIADGQEKAVLHPLPIFFDTLLQGSAANAALTHFLQTAFTHADEAHSRGAWQHAQLALQP